MRPRLSTVSTLQPSACTANIRQERALSPSTSTVQAPQTPCSQPTCVPVRPSVWRRKSASSKRGSTARGEATPLTVTVMSRVLLMRRSLRAATRRRAPGPRARRRDAAGSPPKHADRFPARSPRAQPRSPALVKVASSAWPTSKALGLGVRAPASGRRRSSAMRASTIAPPAIVSVAATAASAKSPRGARLPRNPSRFAAAISAARSR